MRREEEQEVVNYRPGVEEDFNFILNSWLKSSRHRFNQLRDHEYYDSMRDKILQILAKSEVLVASEASTDLIVSYAVYSEEQALEARAIHYVYTKYPFRKMGFASKLIEKINPKYTTIYTSDKTFIFNPLLG